MKVVMVDDSPADRRLCQILLCEVYGPDLAFFEAGGAAQGLETCRRESPDCVLLDYKLPDMTGLEFLARLCPHDGGDVPGTAVVMLTGLASEQIAIQAMKNGAQDYLVKDRISAESLSLAVRKATEKVSLIRALKGERDLLAQSLAEKEVLIQEVHHRVKNNLAVIASLLRLQASAMPDERLAAALHESQHRVESMALIHEQLYSNGNLREVDLARHAALLASNLFHSFGVDPARIACHVAVEPLLLGVDQAIPAGIILNELISNALKHAFPNGQTGSVTLEGNREKGRIQLSVRDDGIGVSPGVDLVRPHSLGMQIIQILTRQLKGTFEVSCGRPATFKISFPEGECGEQEL
ncbi:MAG TPA: histidine kinase dimerization/phosphoacceptor domain -containing protein [Bryobacteraceae bacterium]|nr:histidine kinase dimerization/phosphoacceptor domain -containing protein [Bryobacteraceae bacterium]